MSNQIGKRGENIFANIITRKSMDGRFLFDPTFLGDKFPTVDFYVALLDFLLKAFFFVSVKTTTQGYSPNFDKLMIRIEKEEIAELSKFNIPVYIFGIDEVSEKGFFIAVSGLDTNLSVNRITVKYPVTATNLEQIHAEVANYWHYSHKNTKFVSAFK